MINAELYHNPYLLETVVRFNGKEPRINCQIEKYERLPLNLWVDKVPEIFYNEMNGYDFELLFTGTKPDFISVQKSFQQAGVTSKQVQLVHKHELDDAYIKSKEISDLLIWLKNNRNRNFDYDSFQNEHASFFDDPYPIIVVNGKASKIDGIPVSVDVVKTIDELQNTDLKDVPVIFYLDNTYGPSKRAQIESLLRREDVVIEQLFFYIDPHLSTLQKERVIAELDLENPQIITSFNDYVLRQYLENYPITEYIRVSIRLFEETVGPISVHLEEDKQKSIITNAEVHTELENLEAIIISMKNAEDYYSGHDDYSVREELAKVKEAFFDAIIKWNNKKIKVEGENEIARMTVVFQNEIQTQFGQCISSIQDICTKTVTSIKEHFDAEYHTIENCDGYSPQVNLHVPYIPFCPDIKSALLRLNEVSLVEKPKDFFGGLFKRSESESIEMIEVVTAYYNKWRVQAMEALRPILEEYLDDYSQCLSAFCNDLASDYIAHLHKNLSEIRERKEQVSKQLSGEERELQIDIDWLETFHDRLEHIQRG